MIPAEYYYIIYNTIVAFLTLFSFRQESRMEIVNENVKAIFLTVFMIVFIGFRPISNVFVDMPAYSSAMITHSFEYVDYKQNFVFTRLMAFMSRIGCSPRIPIVVLAIINFTTSALACRKLFPDNCYMAILVFLGSLSTFGYAVNGLKAGCAAGILLLSLAYGDKFWVSIPLLVLSLGFHHSVQIMVVAYVLCLFYKNTKVYIAVWMVCIILAFLHVKYFQYLFAGFTDEHGAEYLLANAGDKYYIGGEFRWDFILYSAFPIFIWYITAYKYKIEDNLYKFIFNMYLIANSVWLLCLYASASYRIAFLSWCLYPVLIIYPFCKFSLDENQFQKLRWVVIGNVSFSLTICILNYM